MSDQPDFPIQYVESEGAVDVDALAEILLVTREELAASLGLTPDEISESARRAFGRSERRINALARVLERTRPWTQHPRIAFAWFRSQPLPSFGGMTAEDLFKMDREAAVEEYLGRMNSGGYA